MNELCRQNERLVGCHMRIRPLAFLLSAAVAVLAFSGVAGADSETGTITFVRSLNGHMEVFTMNGDGTNSVAVSSMGHDCCFPSLSPDGTRIVFQVYLKGRRSSSEIFTVQTDGTGLRRLTDNRSYDGHPAWSPDGSRILFVSESQNSAGEIYVMGADGSDVTRLTKNHDIDVTPAWSPDGTRIIFARKPMGWLYYNIYEMNADGSGTKRLTHNPFHEAYPEWSPDGSRIIYCTIGRGHNRNPLVIVQEGIRVMNADGTGQERVRGTHTGDTHPSWAPDGTKIVFARRGPFLSLELYVGYPGQEISPTNLTNTRERESDPSWTR